MSQILTVPDDVIDRNPPMTPALDETEAVRRYGRLLQASAGAVRALGGLEGRFTGAADWATASDRFRAGADAIGRDFADSFGGDRTSRALFLRDFASLADARIAAFAGASAMREQEALQTVYAERMAELAQMARSSEGSQRAEILRQAALEVHRAQAFGLEGDPGTAMDRFNVWITPQEKPNSGDMRFGAPADAPADREAYEQEARRGWRHERSQDAVAKSSARPAVSPGQVANTFGFPDTAAVQQDRGRYTVTQNTGEGDEARSFETIGRDYWAARKALDVDPSDEEAAKQAEAFSKELDRHAFWKAMDEVAGEAALEEMVKSELPDKAIFRLGKRLLSAYEVWDVANKYRDYLQEADRIRSGIDITKDPGALRSASGSAAP